MVLRHYDNTAGIHSQLLEHLTHQSLIPVPGQLGGAEDEGAGDRRPGMIRYPCCVVLRPFLLLSKTKVEHIECRNFVLYPFLKFRAAHEIEVLVTC